MQKEYKNKTNIFQNIFDKNFEAKYNFRRKIYNV